MQEELMLLSREDIQAVSDEATPCTKVTKLRFWDPSLSKAVRVVEVTYFGEPPALQPGKRYCITFAEA